MAKKDFMAAAAAAAQNIKVKEFDPAAATVGKMPANISGGKEALTGFMNIPVEKLIPYRSKNGFDFSRHGPVLEDTMVESVKNYGIIEPLSVRPAENGVYEILAGESRWLAAKKAGLAKVPCHVLNIDDIQADAIFAATNIIRRDMTYRDRINGWWRYIETLKKQQKLADLRKALDENPLLSGVAPNGESLGWRQIMRYHTCHNLLGTWIDRLDNRSVGFMVAYQVALLPDDVQDLLLDFRFTEAGAKEIVDYYRKCQDGVEGYTWNGAETVSELLKQSGSSKNLPKGVRAKVMKAVRTGIPEEDYRNADVIIAEALKLYYETVPPEKRAQQSGGEEAPAQEA